MLITDWQQLRPPCVADANILGYLFGEEASRSIGNTLWRVSTMFTRPGLTSPEVYGFGWNLGYSEYIVCSWPWHILGVIRAEARAGELAEILFFFGRVNNARLYRFPFSQISRNLHTRRGSMSAWILSENIWEKAFLGHHLQRLQTLGDDFSEMIKNLGKIMTGWPAYGMLAFRLYRWNQLSHSRGLCSAYKKQHSWTSAIARSSISSAPDVMSQSHSRGGANNITLTLRYC